MKFSGLPRTAADYRAWIDNVTDIVTAAAKDPNAAFAWVSRVEDDSATFDDFGRVAPEWVSLDAKIRSGLTKYLVGKDAEKENKELVSYTLKRRDELRKAAVPRQITGLQIIFLVKSFYRVHDTEKVSFELSALMELEYPGDGNMAVFKDKLDFTFRHLRTKLEDKDKEGIVVAKLRKSDALRPHLEYYDRLPESHADRSYAWVSQLTDTLIDNHRKKKTLTP